MELVRMFLVLGHLVALMAAVIAVAFGDYALLGRRQIQGELLRSASRAVGWGLLALWVSGLSIIYIDTQFVVSAILSKPKLLAKLTVVVVLSANGVLLHARVLPSLQRAYARAQGERVARRAAIAGAVSAAGWVFAVFLGVAKPLAPILHYQGFMGLFAVVVVGAIGVALQVVWPELTRRLVDGGWPDRSEAGRGAPSGARAEVEAPDHVAAA